MRVPCLLLAVGILSCQATPPVPDAKVPAERKLGAANVTVPGERQLGRMKQCPLGRGPALDMTSQEQRQEVKEIYEDLANFMGTRRQRPPRLIFDESENQEPPYYLPDRHAIVVGSKMHNVCAAALGPERRACLAFFLGHELTHFTREHGKLVGAAAGVRSRFSMAQAMHLNEQAEAQADTEGGFFSFLAGYDTLDVSAPSLDAMYTCYGLRDKISGYLSLPKRKELLNQVSLKLKQLALLFDTANYAMMIQRHDLAIMMYQRIAGEYANAELLNGEAAARLMYAQRLQSKSGSKSYTYPLTLDLSSRVKNWVKTNKPQSEDKGHPGMRGSGGSKTGKNKNKYKRKTPIRDLLREQGKFGDSLVTEAGGKGTDTNLGGDDQDGTKNEVGQTKKDDDIPKGNGPGPVNVEPEGEDIQQPKLIPRARKQVEEAVSLLERVLRVHDSEHLPTLINLACARHMLGEWAQAKETIALATSIAQREGSEIATDDLRVIQALLLDVQGKKDQALENLAQVAERRAELVKANKEAVSGEKLREFKALVEPELIMGQPVTKRSHLKNPQLEVKVEAGMISRAFVYVRKRTVRSAEVVEVGVDDRRMFFFATAKKGYKRASAQGIRMGDDKDEVVRRYGSPRHFLSTARGRTIWSYPQGRIFFTFNPQGKVERWTVFYDHLKKS